MLGGKIKVMMGILSFFLLEAWGEEGTPQPVADPSLEEVKTEEGAGENQKSPSLSAKGALLLDQAKKKATDLANQAQENPLLYGGIAAGSVLLLGGTAATIGYGISAAREKGSQETKEETWEKLKKEFKRKYSKAILREKDKPLKDIAYYRPGLQLNPKIEFLRSIPEKEEEFKRQVDQEWEEMVSVTKKESFRKVMEHKADSLLLKVRKHIEGGESGPVLKKEFSQKDFKGLRNSQKQWEEDVNHFKSLFGEVKEVKEKEDKIQKEMQEVEDLWKKAGKGRKSKRQKEIEEAEKENEKNLKNLQKKREEEEQKRRAEEERKRDQRARELKESEEKEKNLREEREKERLKEEARAAEEKRQRKERREQEEAEALRRQREVAEKRKKEAQDEEIRKQKKVEEEKQKVLEAQEEAKRQERERQEQEEEAKRQERERQEQEARKQRDLEREKEMAKQRARQEEALLSSFLARGESKGNVINFSLIKKRQEEGAEVNPKAEQRQWSPTGEYTNKKSSRKQVGGRVGGK